MQVIVKSSCAAARKRSRWSAVNLHVTSLIGSLLSRVSATNMPRIDHQMGRKPVILSSVTTLGYPMHAACVGGYANTVRDYENDEDKTRAASCNFDGFDCMCRWRRCIRQQGTNWCVELCQSDRRQRTIHPRQQRTLRSTSRTAVHTPLNAQPLNLVAAHRAANQLSQNPDAVHAAPGFFRSAVRCPREMNLR